MMKKIFILFACILFLSCSEITNRKLYQLTDKYVESLQTTYESYGIEGTPELTEDGDFQVMPIGRLINVKIMHEASDKEYESLEEELESHYKGDSRVNDVYRCQAGTIMIDCRN